MASPKIEVLFVYDLTTGLPKTGATLTFSTYKNATSGADVAQPSITEIGGGAYKFTPVFANPQDTQGIVYVLATGANANPAYFNRFMRSEDWSTDLVDVAVSTRAVEIDITTIESQILDLHDLNFGKWEIVTAAGADQNSQIFYRPDLTKLLQVDLYDISNVHTFVQPLKRIPR